MIEIKKGIFISEDSLVFRFSRSSGPGGQNVNKISSKVTLLFDMDRCNSLNDSDKQQILDKLSSRMDKGGRIRVVSQRHRTQKTNRRVAVERLAELLRMALQKKVVRRKTKVPMQAKEKRLRKKRQRSLLKQQRAKGRERKTVD
jgi:ribosome-associated protein